MKTKIAPSMTVLSCLVKTNLKSLTTDVGDLNKKIFECAIENGFLPSGPQCWIYKWISPDPNADFELRITLPVTTFNKTLNSQVFTLIKEEPFNCVATIHNGSFDSLKDSYAKIMDYMNENKLQPGQVCREVYINTDFEDTDNCVTEIQFGLNYGK